MSVWQCAADVFEGALEGVFGTLGAGRSGSMLQMYLRGIWCVRSRPVRQCAADVSEGVIRGYLGRWEQVSQAVCCRCI